ncbi:hypothetical protein CNR22_20400 [Sphingobacteriaceae bacterium]|nr:hypothetical protein CNR22_20400 [Sphingobacteriaceae bacterium]
MLFESKERYDNAIGSQSESQYDFLDRFPNEECEKIRNCLNEWFSVYPTAEQSELRTRFKDSFSPAFYELYIYTLFIKQGFKLSCHPEILGSLKRPDFLATKGGIQFYIEATEVNPSMTKKGVNNLKNSLYDALNKIEIRGMLFSIEEFSLKTSNQPNSNLIVKFFKTELAKHSYQEVSYNLINNHQKTTIKYEDSAILVIISLIPVIENFKENKIAHPIGIFPAEEYESPTESIKNSIIKKSNRYGALDKPLILCVNSPYSFGFSEILVNDVFYGANKITYSLDAPHKDEKMERCWEGVYGSPKNPKLKRVSGVLISHVTASSMLSNNSWLSKNPFSSKTLDFDLLSLSYSTVQDNRIKKIANKSIQDILLPDQIMK